MCKCNLNISFINCRQHFNLSMQASPFWIINVVRWTTMIYLVAVCLPPTEARVDEFEQAALKYSGEPTQAPTPVPEPPKVEADPGSKCFHMPRSKCPQGPIKCAPVGDTSVFCCDVNNFTLKEGLGTYMTQNTTNLHVLSPNLESLDVSQAVFRRLVSMSLTDGNIGKIVGQFPRYSSIRCLNISNTNLTSAKLQSSKERPFAYLFNLTLLDASYNNLTEFPLSLVHSNRKLSVDFSGNNYLPCKHFQKAMDSNSSSPVHFENYERTFCALDLEFNWFRDVRIVQLEHLKVQNELNERCREIRPAGANCSCAHDRVELTGDALTNVVAVDCSRRHLTEMPTNLPNNTVKLNVSYNHITSLVAVEEPSYWSLRQLFADHNDITDVVDLEGTKFIDNFMFLSIGHNKLKTIHPHVFSNKFDNILGYEFMTLSLGGNVIHCDCNTEKVLKPWLLENSRTISDYRNLKCEDNRPVVDLVESQVCHTPRDWTDYIYYIIGLEVLVLALLISKVSYDYWVFKSAGYLPWPANKLPRLPCDWLCE